jgi:hypothetical protein
MELPRLTPDQLKVIARIQNSIPKIWTDNVTHKVKTNETIKEVIEKALVDPDVSEETKAKCLSIKNSGELDKEMDVEDPKITKLIDEYVDREIKKAIKRGELPKKAKEVGKNIKRITKAKYG